MAADYPRAARFVQVRTRYATCRGSGSTIGKTPFVADHRHARRTFAGTRARFALGHVAAWRRTHRSTPRSDAFAGRRYGEDHRLVDEILFPGIDHDGLRIERDDLAFQARTVGQKHRDDRSFITPFRQTGILSGLCLSLRQSRSPDVQRTSKLVLNSCSGGIAMTDPLASRS